MDIAADVIAGIALLVSGFAVFDGRKQAAQANKAAERAAAAAEAQVKLATPPAIAFKIDRMTKTHFALRNTGTQRATGVTIVSQSFGTPGRFPVNVALDPGQAAPFDAFPTASRAIPASTHVLCAEHPAGFHVAIPPL